MCSNHSNVPRRYFWHHWLPQQYWPQILNIRYVLRSKVNTNVCQKQLFHIVLFRGAIAEINSYEYGCLGPQECKWVYPSKDKILREFIPCFSPQGEVRTTNCQLDWGMGICYKHDECSNWFGSEHHIFSGPFINPSIRLCAWLLLRPFPPSPSFWKFPSYWSKHERCCLRESMWGRWLHARRAQVGISHELVHHV